MNARTVVSSDVIVLGSGAAGLAAAASLSRRGLNVTVLEARSRMGGRIHTLSLSDSVPLELGAEFVHGKAPSIWQLCRREQLQPQEIKLKHFLSSQGKWTTAAQAQKGQEILQWADEDISIVQVLRRPDIQKKFPLVQRRFAEMFVEGFYVADPSAAGSRGMATMEKAEEALEGDRSFRIAEGYHSILKPLVKDVERHGTIWLNAIAKNVRWRSQHVEVEAMTQTLVPLARFVARQLVVALPVAVLALPPSALAGIQFSPPLTDKAAAIGGLRHGSVVKALLRFRTAFWKKEAFLHQPGKVFPTWWTLSPLASPTWIGWAGGPSADRLHAMSPADRCEQAIQSLSYALGLQPDRLESALESWQVVDWADDPFSQGAYAVLPVGAMALQKTLAASVSGTLFFAGEATHFQGHAGTVHGALESGLSAAKAITQYK